MDDGRANNPEESKRTNFPGRNKPEAAWTDWTGNFSQQQKPSEENFKELNGKIFPLRKMGYLGRAK